MHTACLPAFDPCPISTGTKDFSLFLVCMSKKRRDPPILFTPRLASEHVVRQLLTAAALARFRRKPEEHGEGQAEREKGCLPLPIRCRRSGAFFSSNRSGGGGSGCSSQLLNNNQLLILRESENSEDSTGSDKHPARDEERRERESAREN